MGVALAGACAQQGAPPGGPEDRRPPVVVATVPDTFAIVPDFTGAVVFEFDERISERVAGGGLENAVLVSPRTGEVRVTHGRRSLTVELDGGFQPGLVYRVTLLPAVSDLFGNQLRDPFELVFSRGGPPPPTTIAGLVWDRLTGRGLGDYAVHGIVDEGDSIPHVAVTDTGGVFALRHVPEGRYTVTAFEDRNRNDTVDPMEPQGDSRVLMAGADTLILAIPVLSPDTSSALITEVTPLDSVTLVVEFDDYLDPVAPIRGVGFSIRTEEGLGPAATEILHEYEYDAWVDQVADSFARLDSLDAVEQARVAAESARADSIMRAAAEAAGLDATVLADSTTGAEVDSIAPSPLDAEPAEPADTVRILAPVRTLPPRITDGPPKVAPPGAGPDEAAWPRGPYGLLLLPSRRIVVRLNDALTPNVAYTVAISAVRNIQGVPLGGGESALILSPPDVPDTSGVPADSAGLAAPVEPDTGVVIDTTRAAGDTVGVLLGRRFFGRR